MNIKPFGERIALITVEETYSGKIQLPESRNREYVIGRCVAVGNGTYADGVSKPIYTRVGSTYLFQIDAMSRVNATFKVGEQLTLILHQADMICELASTEVSFESVSMVGHWTLVEPYIVRAEGSLIEIPDSAKETTQELQHFRLLKKGSAVTLDAEVGDEVFAARGRITPISLGDKIYGFIQDNFIFGSIPSVTEVIEIERAK